MLPHYHKSSSESGFSLIQMSIVLLIIGLLTGGIIAGQNLINAAEISAQISQMDKYNTALNLFETKYGYLPGDIPDPKASNFGFVARGMYRGEGDGNGVIEGNCSNLSTSGGGFYHGDGEIATFWVDLSTAGFIDSTIFYTGANYPNPTTIPGSGITLSTTPNLKAWLPVAKAGKNTFIYVYSLSGANYFAISSVTTISCALRSSSNPNVTVQQAFAIDNKMDDGLPQSGDVTACYVNANVSSYQASWAAGGNGTLQGASGGINCVPTTMATSYLSTNCYDNNGVAGPQAYSVSQNGNLPNCALSFKIRQ